MRKYQFTTAESYYEWREEQRAIQLSQSMVNSQVEDFV